MSSHRLEYAAVRSLIAVLSLVGWRRAGAVGAWLGRVAYAPVGIRRRVVLEHLQQAFPEWTDRQREDVARGAYENLGRSMLESMILATRPAQDVLDAVPETPGIDLIREEAAKGQGVIVVTGHIGNWELGGALVAASGLPFSAIARSMANPYFDAYVRRTREALGMQVITDVEAVRKVPRALDQGHVIAFLSDQDALGLASTFVPFFGKPARTPRGPAVFALRRGTPVVFAALVRQPAGHYAFVGERVPLPAPTGNREADSDAIVAAYTRQLEALVRRYPAQYFWHHRRWKRQPEPVGS